MQAKVYDSARRKIDRERVEKEMERIMKHNRELMSEKGDRDEKQDGDLKTV